MAEGGARGAARGQEGGERGVWQLGEGVAGQGAGEVQTLQHRILGYIQPQDMDVLADLSGDGEVAEMLVCVRLLYPLVLGSPVLQHISQL